VGGGAERGLGHADDRDAELGVGVGTQAGPAGWIQVSVAIDHQQPHVLHAVEAALASKGAGGAVCRLSTVQLARLRAELDKGPAAWGWAGDQRWMVERVTTLIGRLFHVRYTLRGTSYLLHRIGFTPRVPVHRAAERGEQAIATWRDVTWVKLRG
jgi:transposase